MTIDLDPTTAFEGTAKSWVKCARCSLALGRPYPVESMAVEGADAAQTSTARYKMVVRVGCHGDTMPVTLEVPIWWGESMRYQALAYIYAFVRGHHCEVRRGTRGQSPGSLVTDVR